MSPGLQQAEVCQALKSFAELVCLGILQLTMVQLLDEAEQAIAWNEQGLRIQGTQHRVERLGLWLKDAVREEKLGRPLLIEIKQEIGCGVSVLAFRQQSLQVPK